MYEIAVVYNICPKRFIRRDSTEIIHIIAQLGWFNAYYFQWAIPENIHTPPKDDTELGPKNFRISKTDNWNFCRIPEPSDSKS